MIEQTISIERMEEIVNLFGSFDENIRLLEQEYQVSIVCRDDHLKICGEPDGVLGAQNAITELLRLAAKGEQITPQNVNYVVSLIKDGQQDKLSQMGGGVICVTAKGRPIKAKTVGRPMWTVLRKTPSPWAWGLPVPARLIWQWPRRWWPSGKRPSTGSSSPVRRWRLGKSWAFFQGICKTR